MDKEIAAEEVKVTIPDVVKHIKIKQITIVLNENLRDSIEKVITLRPA